MVEASMLRAQDADQLMALVQTEHGDEQLGAPDAATYQTHGGNILNVLGDLLEKQRDQIGLARHTEFSSMHNFKMLDKDLTDTVRSQDRDLVHAKAGMAAAKGHKAINKQDVRMQTDERATKQQALESLRHTCARKALDHKNSQRSRSKELAALSQTVKAISELTGGAGKLVYGMGQLSFMQCARDGLGMDASLAHTEVVRFLRHFAQSQHSSALSQLSQRVSSIIREAGTGEDPFGKVKGLISNLIKRLQVQAQQDASHKAYCDKELAATHEKREKAENLDTRHTNNIDTIEATLGTFKQQVADLQESIMAVLKAQADMDKFRKAEHLHFVQSNAEMEAGIEGVRIALKVLREYYDSQTKDHDAAIGSASGVLGMLEVIDADFAKSVVELRSAEATAQQDYVKATQANDIEKSTTDQDIQYKAKAITELNAESVHETTSRRGVRSQLVAIKDYQAKLVQMCVPKADIYSERKAKRDAEIAGLKEALSIIEDHTVL
eukprot:NODE_4916_length_1831_cov_4.488850.p1 GENE.NODE_4916_length_1831_cov_4.488850~~NODE_4916_length_1831_cov_4.488850.p1  ORF type:complete len:577 (+),score=199.92 NODE_4916_length_1831_cov_4.488850:244-1731(+)